MRSYFAQLHYGNPYGDSACSDTAPDEASRKPSAEHDDAPATQLKTEDGKPENDSAADMEPDTGYSAQVYAPADQPENDDDAAMMAMAVLAFVRN